MHSFIRKYAISFTEHLGPIWEKDVHCSEEQRLVQACLKSDSIIYNITMIFCSSIRVIIYNPTATTGQPWQTPHSSVTIGFFLTCKQPRIKMNKCKSWHPAHPVSV